MFDFSLLLFCSCLLGTSPVHLSLLLGSSLVIVEASAHNKLYQSIPGSSWDRVSIPRALVAVWQRSCVDLGATLGLFVESCVNLKTVFGLLKESNLVE